MHGIQLSENPDVSTATYYLGSGTEYVDETVETGEVNKVVGVWYHLASTCFGYYIC